MPRSRALRLAGLGAVAGLLGLAILGSAADASAWLTDEVDRSVVASGLLNPRGLAFGPDGSLYVAEAGAAGRERVVADPNRRRYRIGKTGRVTRIGPDGSQSVLADGLPSTHTAHDDDVGPTGVAVVDGAVHVLTAAGGWSWGDPSYDNAILRIDPNGSYQPVFDYQGYNLREPSLARRGDPRADVPGGMPFGMVALGRNLYTTDGNHEFVLEVGPDGQARRLLEYALSNRALTGIAAGPDGALYVAEFGPYPYPAESGKIVRLELDGTVTEVWAGLTTPIGIAADGLGTLYAVEFTAPLRQWEHTGRVLRRAPNGRVDILATGLNFPAGLALGPDGNLYVANNGNLSADGSGEILRLDLRPRGWAANALRALARLGGRFIPHSP